MHVKINNVMSSTRIAKVERLIQKEISEVLHRIQTDEFYGSIIGVTVVRISPDFSLAKVYLSLFPHEKADQIFSYLNDEKKQIRFKLGQRIGKQMRIVPELAFYIDDSLDYMERIDKLLK